MKISFEADFAVGEMVFLVSDPQQYRGFVLNYVVNDIGNVQYAVSFPTRGIDEYFGFELSSSEDIEYRQKYEYADT